MTMETPNRKTFYMAAVFVLFLCSGAMGFLLNEVYEMQDYQPEQPAVSADIEAQKPEKSEKPRQFQWQECYALCEQYELDCEPAVMPGDEATEAMLKELSLSELLNRYPIPEWSITENDDNVVTISRCIEGMCETHRKVYHLGANESGQYVAVYLGPSSVGDDGGAFLVTDVRVENLSDEQRTKLNTGEYEYYSQDDLIAMLDNFSEL